MVLPGEGSAGGEKPGRLAPQGCGPPQVAMDVSAGARRRRRRSRWPLVVERGQDRVRVVSSRDYATETLTGLAVSSSQYPAGVSGSSPSARHSPRRLREWIDLLSRKVQAKKGIRQGLIQLLCSSVRILSWESLLPGPKRALPAALRAAPSLVPSPASHPASSSRQSIRESLCVVWLRSLAHQLSLWPRVRNGLGGSASSRSGRGGHFPLGRSPLAGRRGWGQRLRRGPVGSVLSGAQVLGSPAAVPAQPLVWAAGRRATLTASRPVSPGPAVPSAGKAGRGSRGGEARRALE